MQIATSDKAVMRVMLDLHVEGMKSMRCEEILEHLFATDWVLSGDDYGVEYLTLDLEILESMGFAERRGKCRWRLTAAGAFLARNLFW